MCGERRARGAEREDRGKKREADIGVPDRRRVCNYRNRQLELQLEMIEWKLG